MLVQDFLDMLDLINDLNTRDLLFETLCVRGLRVFASALDGQVYHFRNKYGLECGTPTYRTRRNYLKTLAVKTDTDKMKAPSFLMVLTATRKFAYRRADGVYVVPIGCLKD